ncbi:hypothetical protein AAG906_014301 [Vitis piasezkii]
MIIGAMVPTLSDRYLVNSASIIALWDEAVLFFHFGCIEKPMEIDHHLYEFGSVEYHVQQPHYCPKHSALTWPFTLHHRDDKGICSDVLEVVEPAREDINSL